jgi:hypothetical protein
VHRETVDADASQTEGIARYIATQDGVRGGSVAATLQRHGPNASVELEPGNPASRTLVSEAIRQGLLQRDFSGRLVDAPRQKELVEASQRQPDEKPETDPGAEDFDPEQDAEWAKAIEPLSQSSYDAAVASSIGAVIGGNRGFERAAENLAKAAGMQPGDAHAYVQAGYDMYRGVVDRAVGSQGIPTEALEAFYADCRTRQGELQEAIQRVVHMRDVSGFHKLAQKYIRRNGGGQ